MSKLSLEPLRHLTGNPLEMLSHHSVSMPGGDAPPRGTPFALRERGEPEAPSSHNPRKTAFVTGSALAGPVGPFLDRRKSGHRYIRVPEPEQAPKASKSGANQSSSPPSIFDLARNLYGINEVKAWFPHLTPELEATMEGHTRGRRLVYRASLDAFLNLLGND